MNGKSAGSARVGVGSGAESSGAAASARAAETAELQGLVQPPSASRRSYAVPAAQPAVSAAATSVSATIAPTPPRVAGCRSPIAGHLTPVNQIWEPTSIIWLISSLVSFICAAKGPVRLYTGSPRCGVAHAVDTGALTALAGAIYIWDAQSTVNSGDERTWVERRPSRCLDPEGPRRHIRRDDESLRASSVQPEGHIYCPEGRHADGIEEQDPSRASDAG